MFNLHHRYRVCSNELRAVEENNGMGLFLRLLLGGVFWLWIPASGCLPVAFLWVFDDVYHMTP